MSDHDLLDQDTDDFDAFENTGDLTEDSEERVVHVDDGNYGPTDDEDLSEVPPQSLDDVIDELHEDDETILAPIGDQLKKPAGELLSPIALQGVSAHAKKRPISALDDRWLQSTWERISGLLSEQPDADEAPDWKHDVRLLEAAAEERELDLWAPAEERAPKAAAAPTTELTEAMRHASTGLDATSVVVRVPVKDIAPDPAQARDEGADDELADLIRANGFYESKPIEVRPHPHAGDLVPNASAKPISYPPYMIVDGERRYRGALKAGLTHVPAMIVEAPDEGERLLRQVNSNQGKPLKPLEEARAWKRIMDAKGWTAQHLADHIGRKKSTVGDRLAMLEVPKEFVEYFEQGVLSAAAAPMLRPLMSLPDRARARVIEGILKQGDFEYMAEDSRKTGKPIKLSGGYNTLESEVTGTLCSELRAIDPKLRDEYKGKVVTVGKTDYAVDVAAYDAALKKAETAAANKKKTSGSASPKVSDAQRKANQAEKDRLAKERAAREREAAARERKDLERKALATAVLAKVPDSLDAKWALFLVRAIMPMAFDFAENGALAEALGLPSVKKASWSQSAEERAVLAHGEKLDLKGRIRLALQLAAFTDRAPYMKDDDRTLQAAALLKIDPKKVKLPALASGKSPRDVPCPECKAKAGSPCKRPSGHTVFGGGFHAARKA